jgi:branched-chain amino acid aminotransferase
MDGVRLGRTSWKRPSPETAPTAAKCSSLYAIGAIAKRQAEAEGCADVLMLDWRGLVSETTGANIFLVIDGALHTPTPDCFLDGITRRTVMRLARLNQIKVIERPIEEAEIARATEVFLAGTAAEVTPVRRIGALDFTPGAITERMIQDYGTLVRRPAEAVAAIVG